MKLAIFGGTGRTGRLLVEQALAAGHEVTVLARTPAKLDVPPERLRVVQGDALDPNRVEEAVQRRRCRREPARPGEGCTPPFSEPQHRQHHAGGRAAAVSAGWSSPPGPASAIRPTSPGSFDKPIGVAPQDCREGRVRGHDGHGPWPCGRPHLDWTLVRIPLVDRRARRRGRRRLATSGRARACRLSRADLAAFMLQQAAEPTYLRQAPVVSN